VLVVFFGGKGSHLLDFAVLLTNFLLELFVFSFEMSALESQSIDGVIFKVLLCLLVSDLLLGLSFLSVVLGRKISNFFRASLDLLLKSLVILLLLLMTFGIVIVHLLVFTLLGVELVLQGQEMLVQRNLVSHEGLEALGLFLLSDLTRLEHLDLVLHHSNLSLEVRNQSLLLVF